MKDLIDRFLKHITLDMKCRPIPRDGHLYLDRHYIGNVFGCEVFLHRYMGHDPELHLHNHPAWGLGIPIIGGYTEEVLESLCHRVGMIVSLRDIRPWRWNLIGLGRFHRITRVEPMTWTLFIIWPRVKGWGFMEEQPRSGTRNPNAAIVSFYQPFADDEDTFNWDNELTAEDVRRERFRARLRLEIEGVRMGADDV